jgi:hypothetical protein
MPAARHVVTGRSPLMQSVSDRKIGLFTGLRALRVIALRKELGCSCNDVLDQQHAQGVTGKPRVQGKMGAGGLKLSGAV